MSLDKEFESEHIRNLVARNRKIEAVFNATANNLSNLVRTHSYPNDSWNGVMLHQVNEVLGKLREDIKYNVKDSMVNSWNLANEKNNILVDSYLGKSSIDTGVLSSMHQLNMNALDQFINRTDKGMNLSDRIWRITDGAKEQLELYVASGVVQGKGAAALSRDVRMLLKEPDRLFRRVRDEKGNLVLSRAAKAYHPGRGVYRSSYKNALRMTRTETNMAYRMGDSLRRSQIPFVTGIEVKLSAAHPINDMCDALAGEYPKGFLFTGWHPQCICYTESMMLNKDQFMAWVKGGRELHVTEFITKIPSPAKDWIEKHADRLKANPPYWVSDNFRKIGDGLRLKSKIYKAGLPEVKEFVKSAIIDTPAIVLPDPVPEVASIAKVSRAERRAARAAKKAAAVKIETPIVAQEQKATSAIIKKEFDPNLVVGEFVPEHEDALNYLQKACSLDSPEIFEMYKDQLRKLEVYVKQSTLDEKVKVNLMVKLKRFTSEQKMLEFSDRMYANTELRINVPIGDSYKDRGEALVEKLIQSEELKNQFETRTSFGALCPTKGSARDKWEKALYNNSLHKRDAYKSINRNDYFPTAEAKARPVYGSVRNTDIYGDKSAARYGDVEFILKDDVKRRASFTIGNSSAEQGAANKGAVAYGNGPLINGYLEFHMEKCRTSNSFLREFIEELAAGPKANDYLRPVNAWNYIETQIIGGVRLGRDIKKLRIPSSSADLAHIKALAARFNIPIEVMQ